MFLQVVDLIFAGEGEVAGRGYDLDFGSEDLESEVESHLVVPRTGRTVGYCVGPYLLGIFERGDRLEDTLGADRDRIGAVAEHVPCHHILYALVVIILSDIEGGM